MGRSTAVGALVAAGSLVLTTLLLYPLGEIAPPVSLGVLYLLTVLLLSTLWGLWLGVVTAGRGDRVQLLPHPAHGVLHDRRGGELVRAGRLRGRGAGGLDAGRARARPRR